MLVGHRIVGITSCLSSGVILAAMLHLISSRTRNHDLRSRDNCLQALLRNLSNLRDLLLVHAGGIRAGQAGR